MVQNPTLFTIEAISETANLNHFIKLVSLENAQTAAFSPCYARNRGCKVYKIFKRASVTWKHLCLKVLSCM